MEKTIVNRYYWADILRIGAIFAVIIQHLSPALYNTHYTESNILVSITDWCVPIFVMLSGMFTLAPEKDLPNKKLIHKILHLAVALCFWSIVYGIFYYTIQHDGSYTVMSIIGPIVWKRLPWYHLWFLYMIIGLYILTPLLRSWIRSASNNDIKYFLLLCFLFNTITYINHFIPAQIHHLLPSISAFVGYYVLGYYLSKVTIKRTSRYILYALSAISCFFIIFTNQMSGEHPHSYDINSSPLVAIMSMGVFVGMMNLPISLKCNSKLLAALSSLTLGIYLVHDIFIHLIRIPYILDFACGTIILKAVVIYILSAIVTFLLQRIPIIGKYIT